MYTSFYNLDSRPFETLPDPVFLWLGAKHEEALTALRYGILENKGFLLLTGDAGTGKTTLINALTQNSDKDVEWAVIGDPSLERLDFYNAIAKGFGIDREFTSKVQFLLQFSNFLHKAHDENKKVVLLIDDCHRLSQDMLEELRLLSNIEKAETKLINIFFIGRREFNDMLVQPKNRAVRQRLTLKSELVPLTGKETEDYIRYRLHIAGTEEKLFTAKAVQIIHRASKGIPRLINIICDHAMVAGSVQGKRTLDHRVLEGCMQKLNLPVNPSWHDFDGLADEKSHLQHFRGRFTAGTSDSKTTVSGFNLEGDGRRGWLKYALGVILVVVTGVYFYSPAEKIRETVMGDGGRNVQQPAKKEIGQTLSSPAVAMLEQNEQVINEKKTAVMKRAILEKAYNAADDKALEEAVAQTGTLAVQMKDAGQAPAEPADTDLDAILADSLAEGTGSGRKSGKEKTGPVPKIVADEKIIFPVENGDAEASAEPSPAASAAAGSARRIAALKQKIVAGGGAGTEPATKVSQADAKPATSEREASGDKGAGGIAPMEPNKVVLGLRPNSLELTGEAAVRYRDFVAKLKDYPQAQVLVKGFVSAKTNSPENVKLSEERAMGVQKLLVESGVEAARIEIRGLGNQEPVASNATREGRAKNRRVEVIVVNDGR